MDFNNIYISVTGTAFRSVETDSINYTEKELKNETVELSQQYQLEKSGELTAFKDHTSGKTVAVEMSYENLQKIEDTFGEDALYIRDDKTVRLTGEAEAFVSGWYQDIAYKREFLNSDKNSDNILDKNEYSNVKNHITFTGEIVLGAIFNQNSSKIIDSSAYINSSIENTYQQISNIPKIKDVEVATSIAEELDRTLNLDTNFNGKITLKEMMKDGKNISTEEASLKEFQKEIDFIQENSVSSKSVMNNFINKLKSFIAKMSESNTDENSNKKDILNKLTSNGYDKSQLTDSEKEVVDSVNREVFREVVQDKLKDIVNTPKLDLKG